jgi:hypothetical protein
MVYMLLWIPPFVGIVQVAIQIYALRNPCCCMHK